MNVTVIGTGFVGVVSAGVFAKFGNKVTGLDIDQAKIKLLQKGKAPFYEPGLEDLLNHGLTTGYLKFSSSYAKAIPSADIIILAVGTPAAPDGQADLKFIKSACTDLAPHLSAGTIIAIKSTVPPGTNALVEKLIGSLTNVKFFTASLPEFLKEGSAVSDALYPDRVVIGTTSAQAISRLKKLHQPLSGTKIIISPESAQMSKYAANAYLAQRITFINQIANLCEKNGADVQEVIKAMGQDKRIGSHYWYPGLGYGGSCFPKDVKELAAYSRSVGEGDGLFVKIDKLNEVRIQKLLTKFSRQIGGWKGKKVAVLGLSFKPHTNDIREAPSLKVIPYLIDQGARVVGYDPQANQIIKSILPRLTTASSTKSALKGSDVAILLVEWPEFSNLDLKEVHRLMKGNIFIDTRNQYDPITAAETGLQYISIGRSPSIKN